MNPILYRYKDTESVIKVMDGYTPGEGWTPLYDSPQPSQPERKPMDRDSVIDLVKECGLDWHRGFVPLFDDDPTNRFAVLVEAVEAFHGIKP